MKTGTKIIMTNSPYEPNVPNGSIMTVTYVFNNCDVDATIDGGDGQEWYMGAGTFKEYTHGHATLPDGPTMWQDMTPEEKGALLLAHHDGKEIQWTYEGWFEWGNALTVENSLWKNFCAYRVSPKPVVETVVLCYRRDSGMVKNRIGTINLIDGKPDMASIIDTKTEEL
jgi:hypothetical protein